MKEFYLCIISIAPKFFRHVLTRTVIVPLIVSAIAISVVASNVVISIAIAVVASLIVISVIDTVPITSISST